jgi:hypothetical protein
VSWATIAGLAACLGAALFVLGGLIWVALRAVALVKRAKALEVHPSVRALNSLGNEAASLGVAASKLGAMQNRFDDIADHVAEIAAAAAMMNLSIDRVAFATRLLLQTFVPTLAGIVSD